jgi:chromosomal replication initiation ATPase DnaA
MIDKTDTTLISPYVYPGLPFQPDNDLKRILVLVCDAVEISIDEVQSKCRKPKLANARQVYCYIAKANTTHSLKKIGELINVDHSTVIYYIKKIEEMISVNDKLTMALLQKLHLMNDGKTSAKRVQFKMSRN